MSEPLNVKVPFSLKPEMRLFWVRTKLTPKAIWCRPRIQSMSSANWKLLTLKWPGAHVPQPTLKALFTVTSRKLGTLAKMLMPRSVGLI